MVGHEERQRLLRGMYEDPTWKRGVVLTAAAYLAIIVGVAAMVVTGSGSDNRTAAPQTPSTRQPTAVHVERAAVVESRRILEARRRQFENRGSAAGEIAKR